MEIWDGYLKDGSLANKDLLRGEPIPGGLYHLVCEILVRHTDGDYLIMQRDFRKPNFAGCYEATAGGSAHKGEDKLTCAKRELLEETGIFAGSLKEIGSYLSHDTIYYQFLCITDCDKTAVRLQEGETVAYRWLTEDEFIAFVNSGSMIPVQKDRYASFLKKLGYLAQEFRNTLYIGFRGMNNPSCILAKYISRNALLLTNSFGGLQQDMGRLEGSYDYAIMFGVDKSLRNAVRLELTAEKNGSKLQSRLDLELIANCLTSAGITNHISSTPTHYLCNEAYWLALQKFNGQAVFLHIPSSQNSDNGFLEKMKAALSMAGFGQAAG